MESLKQLQWSVFLCYDTDDYKYEISKFQEGDWRRLRNKLNSIGTTRIAIYDMAAAADIEDVMLKGINSICAFLRCGAMTYEELSGAKGKVKMKKLFRKAGRYYHEGDRAGEMIRNLDIQNIVNSKIIDFTPLINKLNFK